MFQIRNRYRAVCRWRLAGGRIARVEAHLAECADCRALAEELRASHALLGELRDEPLEEAMVAQVHRPCPGGSGTAYTSPAFPRRAGSWLWPQLWSWPWSSYGPDVIVGQARRGTLWVRRRRTPPKRRRAAGPPQLIRSCPTCAEGPPPASHAIAQPGPPLLVQFVTDDPNIVIYWLVDQKPQGD